MSPGHGLRRKGAARAQAGVGPGGGGPRDGPAGAWVDAPARLHLGVLDLRAEGGRRFGGIGIAVDEPRVRLVVEPSEALAAAGPQSERAAEFARRYLAGRRPEGEDSPEAGFPDPGAGAVRIRIDRAIPEHVGLGSGTQLGLAVARGIDLVLGRETPLPVAAALVGRGRRSGIGCWAFERGGFILEGGSRSEEELAPLLSRMEMPAEWRAVLVRPEVPPGLSGELERRAFAELEEPDPGAPQRVAQAVLMRLLPALARADLEEFGAAAELVEAETGRAFAAAQGGLWAHPEVGRAVSELRELGTVGVGQSSWGPTVYGLAGSREEADRIREALAGRHPGWWLRVVGFDDRGARSGRGAPPWEDRPVD